MDEAPKREIVLPRGFYVALGVGLTGYVVYSLRSVITPLFLAFAIAYVLDPVIDRLEAWRIPRPLGILLVLLVAVGAVGAFLALALPTIATEVVQVASSLPSKVNELLIELEPWLTRHGLTVPHTVPEWMQRFGADTSTLVTSVLAPAGGLMGALVGSSISALGSVVAALVVPVLAVYFLNDFDRIVAGTRELLPRRYRRVVTTYAKEIDIALTHFIRGQLLVMAILAVLYGASYAALGVPLAIPIGALSGLLSFIPYLGSAFALFSGLLMSLLLGFDLGQLAGVVVAYTIVQTLEGFVIAPRIMGKTVGLPEMWVLVALFIGGEIFGFLGVLLAVPAAAVAKIFVTRAVERYQESELYLEAPESMRSIVPPAPSVPSLQTPLSPPASTTPPSRDGG